MTEGTRGQLVRSIDGCRTYKPIEVHVTSAAKNLYDLITAQHPRVKVGSMRIRYVTLVKMSVGENSYLPVGYKAKSTNSPKLHINVPVFRYYDGGEVEEEFLIAKVDTDTGELDIKVPNDFVIEVTLGSR